MGCVKTAVVQLLYMLCTRLFIVFLYAFFMSGRRLHLVEETTEAAVTGPAATEAAALPGLAGRQNRVQIRFNKGALYTSSGANEFVETLVPRHVHMSRLTLT